MSKICETVEQAILPKLEELNVELVDVEFITGKNEEIPTLWIYIYKKEGVDLDLLEVVHHALDPIIDELNPTGEEPYNMNVSSPGLDRAFKKQADFDRNIGKEVELRLYANLNGTKIYSGELVSADSENVTIIFKEENMIIEMTKIAKVSMAINFKK